MFSLLLELSVSMMTLLVMLLEILALCTMITTTLAAVTGIPKTSPHGTNAVSVEVVSELLLMKHHALTMTPPVILPETPALDGTIKIHLDVETTILTTSMLPLNAVSVVEAQTTQPVSLKTQLPNSVRTTTLFQTHSVTHALAGTTTTHPDVVVMTTLISQQKTLAASVEVDHSMISLKMKLNQLKLDVSTTTLFQTHSETLALAGMIATHLDAEVMMTQTLLHQLLAVLVVEEYLVMSLSHLQLLLKLATLISLPSILLVTLAPGMTCTVELTVKALGMMTISQLLLNAALAVEEIIFQLKILLNKLLKQLSLIVKNPLKPKRHRLLLLMPPLPMVLL